MQTRFCFMNVIDFIMFYIFYFLRKSKQKRKIIRIVKFYSFLLEDLLLYKNLVEYIIYKYLEFE